MKLVLIAAVDKNRGIGKNNQLLYRIPADLKRFKKLTEGNTVIMGRKTLESIGRALPNRRNIVVSSHPVPFSGVERYSTLEDALTAASFEDLVYVIGGGQMYTSTIKYADQLELTEIQSDTTADTFFPEVSTEQWKVTAQEYYEGTPSYTFVTYTRK